MKKSWSRIQNKVNKTKCRKMLKKADELNYQANGFIKDGNAHQAQLLIKQANQIREKYARCA